MAGVPGLLDHLDSDTRDVLPAFARIRATLATGRIKSEDAAADRALDRLRTSALRRCEPPLDVEALFPERAGASFRQGMAAGSAERSMTNATRSSPGPS
ncbi:aminoglycoside adenylyltransferase domain-containing protein [Streptomyces sp. NPDC093094]|uniref:aminoglycoside adenylyltransferase domain-containing protein n=1 Tax=Streptomyces sp. NPDC093094 TaxID=3366026 RepID=UPI00381D5302